MFYAERFYYLSTQKFVAPPDGGAVSETEKSSSLSAESARVFNYSIDYVRKL